MRKQRPNKDQIHIFRHKKSSPLAKKGLIKRFLMELIGRLELPTSSLPMLFVPFCDVLQCVENGLFMRFLYCYNDVNLFNFNKIKTK